MLKFDGFPFENNLQFFNQLSLLKYPNCFNSPL